MKLQKKAGATSEIWQVFIRDSSSTTGAGLTGLAFNTAGLTAYYNRDTDSAPTAITLVTMTAGTFTSGGFKEISSSNMPGWYQFCPPNAALASGAKSVGIHLKGAANMSPLPIEVQLTAVDFDVSQVIRVAIAQGGNSTSITLDSGASATTDLYRGLLIQITAGTGAGQCRTVNSYNGATKIANVDRGWFTNPDNTSVFALIAADGASINSSLQVSTASPQTTIRTGTAQAGSTASTIKLDAGASPTDNLYVGNLVQLVSGTGLGQSRTIIAYNGTTKVATVDRNWVTTPDNTSGFAIVANLAPTTFSDQGVAQAGGATSITLASTASATNSVYVGSIVTILSGTGNGQTREITAYNGTTKVATVDSAWSANPDNTSGYAVIPTSSGTGTVGTADVNVLTWASTPVSIDANSLPKVGLAAAGLDAVLVESGITAGAGLTNDSGTQLTAINLRQALALALSALDGVLAGAGGTTVTIKQAGKPAGNTRVTATVDASGNRSALTLKVPD